MSKRERDALLEAMRAAASDEGEAAKLLEKRRWPEKVACPKCGLVGESYQMMDAVTGARNKDFRWRCRGCKRMFTVRTGTVLEETRLPLRVWVHAFWRAAASKKGVSALQISRECRISYKSALFLMHRIRHAIGPRRDDRKLAGTIEADETYVGGKPRFKGPHNKRGTANRTPVFGVVERGGQIRFSVMPIVTAANIKQAIAAVADTSGRLMPTSHRHTTTPGRHSPEAIRAWRTGRRNTSAATFTRTRSKARSHSSSVASTVRFTRSA